MITVDEALARVFALATPPDRGDRCPAPTAAGRVLLRLRRRARATQPPFDASAMDGYAVRAADAPAAGDAST